MADFMDTLKSGITKGVATVSTGSKNIVEKTKINTLIKNTENEIKELYGAIGSNVYNFCVNNAEGDIPRAEFISFCEEISVRYGQIQQYQAKIAELDAEMEQVMGNGSVNVGPAPITCKCGTVNAPGARFCASCGSPLV